MTGKEPKRHLSLRIDESTAARVEKLRGENETAARAYNRVLVAGLNTLENTAEHAQPAQDDSELIRTLREYNATLREQVAEKDAQIASLNNNLSLAQGLHAQAVGLKQLEPVYSEPVDTEDPAPAEQPPARVDQPAEVPKRRGLFGLLFGSR